MPKDESAFTFLQVSDVHLDCRLTSRNLSFPHAKRQQRSKEILDTFLKALALAQRNNVDAVLLPGDLWDAESVSGQTVNRLCEAFADMAGTFVVIAPGNHDYCSVDSFYQPKVLTARGMRPWPDNVHVFRTAQFTCTAHPGRKDVSFTGRAFTVNVPVSERLLGAAVVKRKEAPINILLFHGSLDGYTGKDAGLPGKHTAPFSADELNKLGFSWAAVGHYHHFSEIRSATGSLLGAYSGSLVGRGIDEVGPRYAILGTIAEAGKTIEIERIELDERRIHQLDLDITNLTGKQVIEKLERIFTDSGARKGPDIIHLTLSGRHPVGGEVLPLLASVREQFFHMKIEDRSRPDYLSQPCDQRTTEGKFIKSMLELKEKAKNNEGDGLPAEDIVEDALYYGLDALRQKRIMVRNVD